MVSCRKLAFLLNLVPFAVAGPIVAGTIEPREPAVKTEGKYIVILKDGVTSKGAESHLGWVNDVHKRSFGRRDLTGVETTYEIGDKFRGYTGQFDEATLEEIKKNPDVGHHTIFSTPPQLQRLTNTEIGC